ncbi:PREDICTED: uncharacterized protein LOC105569073 isoform X2 [Vollenhovia emeryi]|uniref:uncharacterized protein LOC105569073 isoform X2 n=1 Tax=Vollenhovia emeryi TaxID=411798 RepID=UPI0005F3BB10|nr:PREDICTED: uncharacterized protein LOC105569073 isoform X2 [Vollenhovia emeryi]
MVTLKIVNKTIKNMLCLKKRRTYSFTQDAYTAIPRRSKEDNNQYEKSLNMAITTLPRKNRNREERSSRMVLTVTEDTPADMLTGSMELLVQLPREHHLVTQKVTVLRSTPMMDLLVQITTAHKLTASSYTLQAIGERGLILPHHPNTPIGALDALQVKLLPKQNACVPHKTKQANQPFETTFRLQVHLPRNQLYVSRVSPKMNLGEILDEVCREKNLDKSKYELRHPVNLEETLDLSLSLQDYHLQEVTLYAKQTMNMGPTLSTEDIMALQRQEERRRQQTKQSVFGFIFKKSKESSLSTDSLGARSVSPARSDETARSVSPLQPPVRPQRKRRPAPKPPANAAQIIQDMSGGSNKDKMTISHSRNSSDSSGYHEASVLSDNPDSAVRLPETLPRRSKAPGLSDLPRKLGQTSQSSKSLGNLPATSETLTISRGISTTSLSSTGLRKKRAAPPPPTPRPLSSTTSTQALERIVDSEESLTSDIEPSKPPSDIGASSKAGSDIDCPKVNSDIGISAQSMRQLDCELKPEIAMYEPNVDIQQNCTIETNTEARPKSDLVISEIDKTEKIVPVEATPIVEQARVAAKKVGESAPLPKPRKINTSTLSASESLKISKHKVTPPLAPPRTLSIKRDNTNVLLHEHRNSEHIDKTCCSTPLVDTFSLDATSKPEETSSKLKVDCTSFNESQINRQTKISENIGNVTAEDDMPLKSSRDSNHQVKNNFGIQNSMELIRVDSEEAHSKFEDKFVGGDKFSQVKKIQDIADNVENRKSLNLDLYLNNKGHTVLDTLELNVSLAKLSERNIIPQKNENDSLEQDDKIRSENIISCNENEYQSDSLRMTLDDSSVSQSMIKLDHMKESRSERLKLLHHQFICQEPSSAQRKTIAPCEIENNVKRANLKDAMCGAAEKSDFEKEKKMCTVISTIPKCEHLDAIREDGALNNITKRVVTEDIDELCERHENYQSEESSGTRNAKRTKVVRSQSKSGDFETDILKRQRRYLTLPPEDIAHALNFNIPSQNFTSFDIAEKNWEQIVTGHCTDDMGNTDIDKGETYAVSQDIPSETDILLQKVSDTLSNVLPTLSSPISESSSSLKTSYTTTSMQTNAVPDDSGITLESIETKNESNELYRSCIDFSVENGVSASTPNITVANSQQDTDYVSMMGEDLSISDWEYQLPAPPSAFRDSYSPIYDDYDTVTLRSVEVFKEPITNSISEPTDAIDSANKNFKSIKNLSNNVKVSRDQETLKEKIDFVSEKEIDIKQPTSKPVVKQALFTSQKSETDLDLRKEMISELENKLETGTLPQTVNKDLDRRNMDSLSAPELAPVDNTLSNFIITTYTKQKSLDIFEEFEESSDCARSSEQKFIKTFATLSRNNAGACNYDKNNATRNTLLINNLSHNKKAINKSEESNADNVDCKLEPKIHDQGKLPYKWQFFNATNDKTNIQRSKSYISMSNNAKYQKEAQGINAKYEPQINTEIIGMRKATSITDLNVDMLRGNEKFSQWRDNILKNQEEPTKEKQLQSLQVLKSILPQLKNAQQAEENVSKGYNNSSIQRTNKYESNEHSGRMSAVLTHDFQESSESKCKPSLKEESTKRYVYSGPPAITLGSWLERSSANIQIKTDTDYTLGRSNTTNGSKTIVNINDIKNGKDITDYTSGVSKNNVTKHEINIGSLANTNPDELNTKKLIAHTSNFKTSNRVNTMSDLTKNEDRPVVMGVELKRNFVKTSKEMLKNDENEVNTTAMNFKELTKTFSQNGNFKQKSKRSDINSSSTDYRNVQQREKERITNPNVKEDGCVRFAKATSQNNNFSFKNQPKMYGVQHKLQAKRFTSVVGVNGMSQNIESQSEMPLRCNVNNAIKIYPPMPVVKGFKIPTVNSTRNNNPINHNGLSMVDGFNKNMQSSELPTMPVITGVTLKNANARPKSMPVHLDPRDMLLESIRNFGGREKLKNTTEKY